VAGDSRCGAWFFYRSLFCRRPGTLCILASRATATGIRLKKYPIMGNLPVLIFQGAVKHTGWLIPGATASPNSFPDNLLVACWQQLLIGGFYRLHIIYQHEADVRMDVKSISRRWLRGTFYLQLSYSVAILDGVTFCTATGRKTNFLCSRAPACLPISYSSLCGPAKCGRNGSGSFSRRCG